MANFNETDYPLEKRTRFKLSLGTKVDRAGDNSPRIRSVSDVNPADLACKFTPMSESDSEAFWTYLQSVRLTELDISHNGRTYRGYIDGSSLKQYEDNGVLQYWAFDFVAVVV